MSRRIPRIGVGGPVGSGKTALIERMVPLLLQDGYQPIVITNDTITVEDAEHVRRTLRGVLAKERILGVETGACPHTAVREDPTMNLVAAEEMERKFPDSDLLLLESGGDNMALTFSSALVDYWICVIDVASGDKTPRKNGPSITESNLLVINKIDIAPYVGEANLEIFERDSRRMRPNKPFLFTNCWTGEGVREVVDLVEKEVLGRKFS